MIKYILSILTFILCINGIIAQNVSFTAQAPKVVAVGENFRLTYTVNAKGSNLQVPSISDFSLISGPNTSSSTSMSIVNGQVSQNVSFSYTYYFQALKEGKFTISPAKIDVEGSTYSSNAVTIEVVKGSSKPQANNQNQTNSGNQVQSSNIPDINGDDLFVRVNVDRSLLYKGEHLIATIKIYTKLDIAGFESMKLPTYNGFWSQEIETPNQISLQRENVNGEVYNVGVLKKNILYPQQSGELTIEPAEITCVVRQRVNSAPKSFFDSFWGSYQNVSKKLLSPKVKITVKALPENKPGSFNGAVGNLSFDASIDKNSVKADEAITMKVKISGSGNLKLIEAPKIDFPPDFEVYDPKITENITNGGNGSSGNKIFEYLIIPRHAGSYKIAPIEFSYFDTGTKSYKTLSSQEFNIEVAKGNGENSGTVMSNFSKEDVKYIGSDIRFLKTNEFKLQKKDSFVFGSLWHSLSYPLSFILFIILVLVRRKKIKENSNVMLVKNRKANKMARKRLQAASRFMKEGNREMFYNELLKALWGYLSDKLSIPVAELTRDNAFDILKNQNLDEQLMTELSQTIDTCEFARFAPAQDSSELSNVYEKSVNLISNLDNKIKKR